MSLRLENEAKAVLDRLVVEAPKTKEDVRRVLLDRKYELMRSYESRLKKFERDSLSLIGRVDYSNIDPTMVYCSPKDRGIWFYLRNVLSSAPWTARPGRSLFMFCIDRNSGGVLGIIDIGSDLFTLAIRDKYIGWTREHRVKEGALRYLVNLGTCVSTAQFGMLTGGKFMAVSIVSRDIFENWEYRYGEPFAGVTTTSLFGKSSQYNRLQEYKYLGLTPGIGLSQLSLHDYKILKDFLRVNNYLTPQGKTGGLGGPGGANLGRLNAVYHTAQIFGHVLDEFSGGQPRGVYFAECSPDSLPFLRGEINTFEQNLKSIDDHAKWWIDRWYNMRAEKYMKRVLDFDVNSYSVGRQFEYLVNSAGEVLR